MVHPDHIVLWYIGLYVVNCSLQCIINLLCLGRVTMARANAKEGGTEEQLPPGTRKEKMFGDKHKDHMDK